LAPDGDYKWRLDILGGAMKMKPIFVDTVQPVVSGVDVSPDPFGPLPDETTLSYTLSEKCRVYVKVFTNGGVLVRKLVRNVKQTGTKDVAWDGKDKLGADVSPGLYKFKIKAYDIAGNKATVFPIITTVNLE
jgi:hypothetical protein